MPGGGPLVRDGSPGGGATPPPPMAAGGSPGGGAMAPPLRARLCGAMVVSPRSLSGRLGVLLLEAYSDSS